MTEQSPEEVVAELRRLSAAPPPPEEVEGEVQQEALTVDGFADLDSFFDDHLELPIRGRVYRIAPASAELGLLCSRLMMAGEQVMKGGKVTSLTQAQLEDDDETELYQRLLGHQPHLPGTGSPEVLCDGGEPLEDGEYDETCPGGEVLAEAVPPTPNPAYREDEDVWLHLQRDGIDWQRIQHVGSTALIWTAVGKPAAKEFWASGARPKASAAPQPRAPQDRRPKAKGSGKSGRPGSTAGTTSPARRRGATAGT